MFDENIVYGFDVVNELECFRKASSVILFYVSQRWIERYEDFSLLEDGFEIDIPAKYTDSATKFYAIYGYRMIDSRKSETNDNVINRYRLSNNIPKVDNYQFYDCNDNYDVVLHIFAFDSEIPVSINELNDNTGNDVVTIQALLKGCVFCYNDIMFNSNALLFIDGVYHLYATNITDIGDKLIRYGKPNNEIKCNLGEPVVCGSVMNDNGIYYQKEYYRIKMPT